MKKIFKTLAVCFLFVAVGCLFACGKETEAPKKSVKPTTQEVKPTQTTTTEAPHTHTWDEGTVTTPATCTEKGVKTFSCACGETKTEEIAALGHDEVSHDGQAATCEDAGWEEYVTCSRCDYTTYQEIEALGHHFSEEYSYDGEQHYFVCTNPGCNAKDGVEAHKGGEATIIAKPVCEVCNQPYGDYLPGPRKYRVEASVHDNGLFYITNSTPLAEGETLVIEIKVLEFTDLGATEDAPSHWTSVQHMDTLDTRYPISGDGTFWLLPGTPAGSLSSLPYAVGDVITVTLKANGPAYYACGTNTDSTSSGAGSYFGLLFNGFNFDAVFEVSTSSSETLDYGVNVYNGTVEMIAPSEYLHIHEFSDQLAYNEEGHYYPCTHEGCTEISGFEAHKGGQATATDKAVCEVCHQPYGDTLAPKYYTIDFVNTDADPVYFGNLDPRTLDEAMTIEFTVAELEHGTGVSNGMTQVVFCDDEHSKLYPGSAGFSNIYIDGKNISSTYENLPLTVGVTYTLVINADGSWTMSSTDGNDSGGVGEHDFYGFGIYPYNFTMKLINVRIYSNSVVDYGVYAFNGGTQIYNTVVTLQEGIIE